MLDFYRKLCQYLAMEYPKIETLFNRDENFKVTDQLRHPVYADIKQWHFTEKIDGTNIRFILEADGKFRIAGRTEKAQFSADLLDSLGELIDGDRMKEVFWKDKEKECEECGVSFDGFQVVVYGEGYGAGIQKGGGGYNEQKTFRMFDCLIAEKWWMDWEQINDIALRLGVNVVPDHGMMSVDDAVEYVKKGFFSKTAEYDSENKEHPAEGLVGKTREPLFDKRGRRLAIKIKTKDFSS